MKMRLLFLIGVFGFLSLLKTASAQYQAAITLPTIIIDKLVGRPSADAKGGAQLNYVDNLGTADYKFRPGQEIFFQLKVKNLTSETVTNTTIQDFVPQYLDPIEGPGAFDETARTITINAGSLAANEEKAYVLKMKILSQDKLPSDRGLFCLVNRAQIKTDQIIDDDTAQFCLEKEVVGVTKVPSAGPAFNLLLLTGTIAFLMVGLYFKSYSLKVSTTKGIIS